MNLIGDIVGSLHVNLQNFPLFHRNVAGCKPIFTL